MRILLLLLLLLSSACAAVQEEPQTQAPSSPPECHEAWVYAPGNYILELAAEATVTLNPKNWDFPVFCTAREAGLALSQEIKAQRLPSGHWGLFRLEGDPHEIAGYQEGKMLLQSKAKLVDWQTWSEKP